MNILVITSVFYIPGKSKQYHTKVINYFIKEWVKSGHKVTVIYNKSVFPEFYYLLPNPFYKFVESRFGVVIDQEDSIDGDVNMVEGAKSYTFPMRKFVPYSNYSTRELDRQADKIVDVCDRDAFVPDLILGHWENPQLYLIPRLKRIYKCKTSIVFHNPLRKVPSYFLDAILDCDHIGFRNQALCKQFNIQFPSLSNTFICPSGIPRQFFYDNAERKHASDTVTKFIYIGTLIKRKHPIAVLEALLQSHKLFSLSIIGDGSERKQLDRIIEEHKLSEQVVIHERLERSVVKEELMQAECFTMISRDEAFGLVYLEAMACGCLVVASRGEGMDGIIIDKVNGFLCEAGNKEELMTIYNYIENLSPAEKLKMAKQAVATARKYTDSLVAQRYLDTVTQH